MQQIGNDKLIHGSGRMAGRKTSAAHRSFKGISPRHERRLAAQPAGLRPDWKAKETGKF
jgi:hypothetical protein